jgi:hypothetical protein
MMTNRRILIMVSVLIVPIATALALLVAQMTGNNAVDASEISAAIAERKAELTSGIDAGATLYLKMDVYDRDRLYPQGVVDPEFHYPDQQIQEVWLGADEQGFIDIYEAAIYSTEGEYLASVTVGQGERVQIDADTGKRFAVPAATGPLKLNDWLNRKFAITDLLAERDFEEKGTTSYLDRPALLFEKETFEKDTPIKMSRIKVVVDNPLLFSESLLSNKDGKFILEKETKILEVKTIPAGEPLGIPKPVGQ